MASSPFPPPSFPFPPAAKKQPPNNNTKPLYYPTIFRYKCRGGFSITSDEPHSSGICRGIQTQLQHIRDLPQSTQEQSLDHFLQDYVPPSSSDGGVSHQNEILDVPAMVFQFDEIPKQHKPVENEHAAVDSPPEVDDDDEWHDWAAYGSTEVRLLVLRDAKTSQEKVVAVAPNCKLGLAVRDVGHAQKGGDTLATVRVGPVEVLLRNQYEVQDDDAVVNNKNANVSSSTATIDDKKSDDARSSSISPTTIYLAGQKVYAQSCKITRAMQTNAHILREATREDFPQRCVASSQRILSHVGKTVTKTADLMQSLYEIWQDDDDNE